jgi:hypothetical protein
MRGAKAARGALAKIAAVLPPERAQALDWPTLLAGASRTGEGEGASLPLIRQALAGGRKLKPNYLGKDGRPSARVVLPAALGLFDHAQMLAAWCETREAFRNSVSTAWRRSRSSTSARQSRTGRFSSTGDAPRGSTSEPRPACRRGDRSGLRNAPERGFPARPADWRLHDRQSVSLNARQ